jgi:hypothetical protein
MVNTNGSPTPLDARLVDLQVRSGNLTPLVAAEGPRARSKTWLLIGGLLVLGLLFVLIAFRFWLYLALKHNTGKVAALALDGQANHATSVPPIATQCSSCGKALKARAEVAGKTVKCSQCGRALLMPPAAR